MQAFPHSHDYQHFLEELRSARLVAGLSQEEVAARLGVHQTLVSKAERGIRRVDVVELRDWASALGISLVDFVAALEARLQRHSAPPTRRR